jgi:hypothetical protein
MRYEEQGQGYRGVGKVGKHWYKHMYILEQEEMTHLNLLVERR